MCKYSLYVKNFVYGAINYKKNTETVPVCFVIDAFLKAYCIFGIILDIHLFPVAKNLVLGFRHVVALVSGPA